MSLKFPADRHAPKAKVFRALVALIANDKTVQRLVKPENLMSWTGDKTDARDLLVSTAPALRFSPAAGAESWYSPESQNGWLNVEVELVIQGFDVTDVINLWYCLERAIYPGTVNGVDLNIANANTLRAAGATTGMVEFSQPAFEPETAQGGGGGIFAKGAMKVEYRNLINP